MLGVGFSYKKSPKRFKNIEKENKQIKEDIKIQGMTDYPE